MNGADEDDEPNGPRWRRGLWLGAGVVSLLLGLVGLALPVVPTVPFVLLAAWCFSRGCRRCERWLLEWPWRWMPAAACAVVALWLWRLPTAPAAAQEPGNRGGA